MVPEKRSTAGPLVRVDAVENSRDRNLARLQRFLMTIQRRTSWVLAKRVKLFFAIERYIQ
jgi:hypothetical protein